MQIPIAPIDPGFGEEKAQSCENAWLRKLTGVPRWADLLISWDDDSRRFLLLRKDGAVDGSFEQRIFEASRSATEGKQGCEQGMRSDDSSRHRPVH